MSKVDLTDLRNAAGRMDLNGLRHWAVLARAAADELEAARACIAAAEKLWVHEPNKQAARENFMDKLAAYGKAVGRGT
jgi:hypothetical protein